MGIPITSNNRDSQIQIFGQVYLGDFLLDMFQVPFVKPLCQINEKESCLLQLFLKLMVKNCTHGAREITQWLIALAAIPEDLGSNPRTHRMAYIRNSSSRTSSTIF